MPAHNCPRCNEAFDAAGALREHAWAAHSACHYCGDRIEGDEETLYRHWLTTHPSDLSRVDRNRAESDVDQFSTLDRIERGAFGAAVRSLPRRWLLLAGGSAVAGVAIGGAVLGGGGSTGQTISGADVPLPDAPGEYTYAVIGSPEASPTVTYYGNWKCPHCARFNTGFFGELVSEYVRPGAIAIEYRNLTYIGGEPFLGPDAPAAARAGLAVWNDDPDSYWSFHEHVFANQPPERNAWATADRLVAFADAAGVSEPEVIRTAIRNAKYESALRETTTAAQNAGVTGTPTLVIDGQAVSALDRAVVKSRIEETIGDA